MRYLKIYTVFLKQYLKGLLEYRVDFLIGMIAFLLDQCLGIFFIYVIFGQITELAQFSFDQILFMYGLSQIPKGIDHLFFDNIWLLPRTLRMGEFDRFLLRPINSLYHFLIVRFQPDAFGEIILGVTLTSIAWARLGSMGIEANAVKIIALICLILISAFIFTGLKLVTATTSFWLTQSYPIMQITYNLNQFARYPLTVFPKAIRFLMSYIIPFAFVAYFPSLYIFGQSGFFIIFLQLIIIASTFMWLGILLWNLGLKKYNSTGS